MNELKLMLYKNEFKNVFPGRTKIPQIDTIRDILKVTELDGLNILLFTP